MAWGGNILPNSFKLELMTGVHVFGTDEMRVALYDNTITPAVGDTVYNTTGELADATGGYSRGAKVLTTEATFPKLVSNAAVMDWQDVSWTSATFTAYGAKIFNQGKSQKLVCELDFGGAKQVSSGTFTIVFPTADQTTGIVRIT